MRRGALLAAVGVLAALGLFVSSGTAWATANWTIGLKSGGSGEAHAQALPVAPTATSACAAPTSGKKVTVSWTAITHATGYAIYQSSTTATGTYTLQATVTTTTWTTAALGDRQLLVRGGGQHRHQLGQRQVGGDRAANHQQLGLLVDH